MKTNKRNVSYLIIISGFILSSLGGLYVVIGDQVVTNTVTVNPPISIENILLHDGSNTINSVVSDGTTIQYLNFTVNRPGGMSEIEYVDIYFHSGSYSTAYNSSSVNITELVHARWIENEFDLWIKYDVWEYNPGQTNGTWDSEWQFGPGSSPGVASGATTFEFVLPFIVSRAAIPGSTWQVSIDITWDDASSITGSSTQWTVPVEQNLTLSTNFIAWGNVFQDGGPLSSSLDITIFSNTPWSLQISGSDFTASGEPSVNINSDAFIKVNNTDTVTSTFTLITGLITQSANGESGTIQYTLEFIFNPANWSGTYGVEYTTQISIKLIQG